MMTLKYHTSVIRGLRRRITTDPSIFQGILIVFVRNLLICDGQRAPLRSRMKDQTMGTAAQTGSAGNTNPVEIMERRKWGNTSDAPVFSPRMIWNILTAGANMKESVIMANRGWTSKHW